MIRAKAIDHVCLWVKSLPESKSYYEKLFGVICSPIKGDNTTLAVESENIHFFIRESENGDGFLSQQHLSFEVKSLDLVIDTLNEMGIYDHAQGEVSYFIHKNYKWCEWRDPSGVRLECVEILPNR